ncbi:laminin B domain-containing protein [Lunatibacter salilacus]|uniref:laminin B domain-containing protein n=1 Tax=Lunatibacter salilacus TaxID=2483804 RepID=UPI003741F1FF
MVQVTADFSSDRTVISEGEIVRFEDLSFGNPTEWTWTFEGGDPENSSIQHPEVRYTNPGIYKVTLTASNKDTEAITTKEGYITVEEKEIVISSGFSADADGWTIVGDAQGGSNIVASYSPFEGLDDSGYIYAEDRVTGGVWCFSAPEKFRGNKSEYYGGTMSFWLIQKSNMRNQFKAKDIIIRNGTKEIYLYHSEYSGLTWTKFEVEISEAGVWLIGNDRVATKIEIEEVLANITAFRIRGEFEYGPDTGGLDKFELKLPL